MGVCAPHDIRQEIGEAYSIPPEQTRVLRAKLIFEEAMETIKALGVIVTVSNPPNDLYSLFPVTLNKVLLDDKAALEFIPTGQPDLEGIIDGVCDLDYVGTGTLACCGVPDQIHREEVCMANERKFPGGKATFNESGKFLKPEGWKGPDHLSIMNKPTTQYFDQLRRASRKLMKEPT